MSLPVHRGGRKGSGGALRSTAQRLRSSAHGIDEVAVFRQDLPGLRERKYDQPGGHFRPDRMQLEFERRDHAEVAAAAAQRPEQVGIFGGAGMQAPAVGQ